MSRAKENTWRKLEGAPLLRPMENIVAKFQKYVETYHQQAGYEDYTDDTFVADILYGLGAALDDDFRFANGFLRFKSVLLDKLLEERDEQDALKEKLRRIEEDE